MLSMKHVFRLLCRTICALEQLEAMFSASTMMLCKQIVRNSAINSSGALKAVDAENLLQGTVGVILPYRFEATTYDRRLLGTGTGMKSTHIKLSSTMPSVTGLGDVQIWKILLSS